MCPKQTSTGGEQVEIWAGVGRTGGGELIIRSCAPGQQDIRTSDQVTKGLSDLRDKDKRLKKQSHSRVPPVPGGRHTYEYNYK